MAVEIRKATEHYNLLHTGQKATALVWTKAREQGNQWHKLEATTGQMCLPLWDDVEQENDVFLTPNEFLGWRRFDLLKNLRACFVDIDKQCTREELNEAIKGANLPNPSAIIFSGRGWHLYWLIDSTPAKALPVWQEMQDRLINAFAEAGADRAARDCARVLRLVGSVNSKNGQQVWGEVLDPTPWKFHDLADEILGYREPRKPAKAKVYDLTAKRAEAGQKPRKASIYAWWFLVYQDLSKIAYSYPQGIPAGDRNNFLFLVSVAMSWFGNPEAISEALADRANKWTTGLDEQEIANACKCSIDRLQRHTRGEKVQWQGKELDPRYFFKRETLWKKLQHLVKPEIEDELRAIISEGTRAKRRAERERARDRVAEGRYKTRKAEGLNHRKPWEEEGISRATWYRKNKKNTD